MNLFGNHHANPGRTAEWGRGVWGWGVGVGGGGVCVYMGSVCVWGRSAV